MGNHLDEFAMGCSTSFSAFKITKNPWIGEFPEVQWRSAAAVAADEDILL